MTRLSNDLIPEDFSLEKLFRIKVFTVLGFLRYDSVKLAGALGKNYQEICELKKELTKKCSSPMVNGMTLYARAKATVSYIPTLVTWQVKNFIKNIQNSPYTIQSQVQLNTRQDSIKIHSLIHHQLSASIFRDMIKYAWFASKLISEEKIKSAGSVGSTSWRRSIFAALVLNDWGWHTGGGSALLTKTEICEIGFGSSSASGRRSIFTVLVLNNGGWHTGAGLDSLLKSAFRSNSILEICGPPGCGKTVICWNAAVNMIAQHNMKILYVDTKGNFSIDRVWSLFHSKYPDKNVSWCLSKMSVAAVDDIYELISTVEKLHETYEDETKKHQVLFIDSISAVPYTGSIKNSGISLMNHLGVSLKRLAAEKNVGVVLTNIAVEEFQDKNELNRSRMTDSALKPAGDRSYWMHAPHHRILVTRESELSSGRIARVIKSDHLPIGSFERFTIDENGVVS